MLKDNKPWFLAEVKLAEENISPNLKYFSSRLMIPGIQVVKTPGIYKKDGNIRVISAESWLGHFV